MISKREDSLICPLFFMYLLIIPINARLNSRKSCLGEQVTESDDQTEQIPFSRKILIPFFWYIQFLMEALYLENQSGSGKNKAARYVRIRSGTG